jgi:hypothetical protein
MKKQIENILSSFDNEKGGYSARKLSAFTSIVIAAYFGLRFGNEHNITELTIIWLSFALICLGIVTFEQLTKFKDGQNNNGKNTEITP